MIIKAFVNMMISNSLASKIVIATYHPDSYHQKEELGDNVLVLPTFKKAVEDRFTNSLISHRKLKVLFDVLTILTLPLIVKASKIMGGQIKTLIDELSICDAIFFPGGNYINAPKRTSVFPSLDQLSSIFCAKHVLKKRVIILPQSIGPIAKGWLRSLTRTILEHVDIIMVREHLSYTYLTKKIGLDNKNVFEIPDMAFMLAYSLHEKKVGERNRVIGITPRSWQGMRFNHPYFKNLIDSLRRLIQEGFRIILVPFSLVKENGDDGRVSDLIVKALDSNKITVKYIRSFDFKKLNIVLSSFDFLIVMRIHSAILAGFLGIPSIIIPTQKHKSYGIAKQLGLQNYLIELPSLTERSILDKVETLSSEMNAIKQELNSRIAVLSKNAQSCRTLIEKALIKKYQDSTL